MEVNAIVLESDIETAQKIIQKIESASKIKCFAATSFNEAKALLKTHPHIPYFFCIYDVSCNREQLQEQTVADYIYRNHPETEIFSIGSIKNPEITFSTHKIVLMNSDDINAFTQNRNGRGKKNSKTRFNLNTGIFKKRGMYVIQ